MADIPTVEAFRAHEAIHGPWMRVKVNGAWVQAKVRVVDPSEWRNYHGDTRPYLTVVLFVSQSWGAEGSRDVQHCCTFDPDDPNLPEWEWCDADGIPVPDIRDASELTPERLDAWEWWCVEINTGFGKRWYTVGREAGGDRAQRHLWLRGYPIHDGNPMRPARWPEVDAAVAARKGQG